MHFLVLFFNHFADDINNILAKLNQTLTKDSNGKLVLYGNKRKRSIEEPLPL